MASEKPPQPQSQEPPPVEQRFNGHIRELSHLQRTALTLFGLGLNVFPLPLGKKGGYPWQMLQYTRLNGKDIYSLFRGECNIAVMTGRTSGNLFVIDCETRATFTHYEQLLQGAGIPIWSVISGGDKGGGHFYLLSKEGPIENVRPGVRKDVEVRGNRCYVLCPPSLHPKTRGRYEWGKRETLTPPELSLDQILWLGLQLNITPRPKTTPQAFSELSSSSREFILSGAPVGERNERLFRAACDLSGNGYDLHAAIQLLVPIAEKCGLSEPETRKTISSAYNKSRTPSKPTAKAKKLPKTWEKALIWAENHAWRGRTGQTDRAVFIACCQRAQTAGEKGIFRASSREIAGEARVTRTTASIALKRLTEAKYLVACGRDSDSRANLYRLGTITQKTEGKILHNRDTTACTTGGVSVTNTRKIEGDASERGALGKTGYNLYVLMCQVQKTQTAAQWAELAHLSIYQVYNAFKKLLEYNLIVKVKTKYRPVVLTGEAIVEQVVRPAGVSGKGQRRKERHQRERAARAGDRLYVARFGKQGQVAPAASSKPAAYRCGNCGQVWHLPGVEPPLVCDYCRDATTWQPVVVGREQRQSEIT